MNYEQLKSALASGLYDSAFAYLYGNQDAAIHEARARYASALEGFLTYFGNQEELRLFSAPGRCEISGNHTDHQHGRVICCSVSMDIIAVCAPTQTGRIRLKSEGYDKIDDIDLSNLTPQDLEKERSASLIRGIAARMQELGYPIGGFDAYTVSSVPAASGISSSAAFELLVIAILDGLYGDGKMDLIERAKIGQYAENVFFGKPSGMLDQCGASIGNLFSLDFKDLKAPSLQQLDIDFAETGYVVVLSKTGSHHADLTDEYAAVPREMKQVAAYLGHEVLREVEEDEFIRKLPDLRAQVGDRALLRSMHFFEENRRVLRQIEALKQGDMQAFLEDVKGSGLSSWTLLQNVYVANKPHEQAVSLALAISQRLLSEGRGVCRIHGGGFSGTILAIMKEEAVSNYISGMEAVFGEGACTRMRVRPVGATEVLSAHRN